MQDSIQGSMTNPASVAVSSIIDTMPGAERQQGAAVGCIDSDGGPSAQLAAVEGLARCLRDQLDPSWSAPIREFRCLRSWDWSFHRPVDDGPTIETSPMGQKWLDEYVLAHWGNPADRRLNSGPDRVETCGKRELWFNTLFFWALTKEGWAAVGVEFETLLRGNDRGIERAEKMWLIPADLELVIRLTNATPRAISRCLKRDLMRRQRKLMNLYNDTMHLRFRADELIYTSQAPIGAETR